MKVELRLGLPEHLRGPAAALYWQAFGGKLGRVMGPEARALEYLGRIIRADHAIVALDTGGALLGLLGFKTPEGAFAGGEGTDLRAIYGSAGGTWRAAVLRLLQSEVDNAHFLIDGICVARENRSIGIGAALLEAVCAEAVARGYAAVRLDVIDTNWRARALYERCGFAVTRTESLGPLRHIFGFSAASTMVRRVA